MLDKPLIIQYSQHGSTLVSNKTKDQYRIVKNNEFGLVAVSSTSEISAELHQKDPTIAATVILIDKHSGDLMQATMMLGQGSTTSAGQCVHNVVR